MRNLFKLLNCTLFIIFSFGCDDSSDDTGTGSQENSANSFQPDASITYEPGEPVTVIGPVTGGKGKIWMATVTDLTARGYTEEEYFFEGDARAYTPQGDMTEDGKWTLSESDQKAYFKTRMMVRRPLDASKFSGTVIVEWLNVSGGTDADPGFMYNSDEILREGHAWVGVSAQEVGIQGGGFAMIEAAPTLKDYDRERYGSLTHPGDTYSYDIYTRAAEVVLGAGDVKVLQGLVPQHLIAYGESQSAGRLVSYVNGVHPLVKVFDGFFIHSRFASSSPFGTDVNQLFIRQPARIRDDLEEPVFLFETESDVTGTADLGGFYSVRQPDTNKIHTWEVAGTAHADAFILNLNSQSEAIGAVGKDIMSLLPCGEANDGPQRHVIKAAIHALNLWIFDGVEPVVGEPLAVDQNGVLSTDDNDNALGGIRSPAVDVPIATLKGRTSATGDPNLDLICGLFGETIPFTPEKLLALYPTHEDYVTKVKESARKAREGKFLLEPEEQAIVAEAEAAPIPN